MILLVLLAGIGAGWSDQARPDRPSQDTLPPLQVLGGTLSFDARATAGRFTGTTSTIHGWVDGGSLSGARGWVEAPAASLITGNGRRDRDMYKSLESDRFPTIRFDLDSARDLTHRGDSLLVRLEGRFTLHGVVRPVSIPAALLRSGDTVALSSTFDLNVKDYQIGGLSKFLGLFRMEEVIGIRVDVLFGPVSPPVSPGHDADTAVTGYHHVAPDQVPGKPPGAIDDAQGESRGCEADDRGRGGQGHPRERGTRLSPDHDRSTVLQGDNLELSRVETKFGGNLAGKRDRPRLPERDRHGVAGRGHPRPVPQGRDARRDSQHEQPQDHEDHEHFDEGDSPGRHERRMPLTRVDTRRLSTRAGA